MVLGFTEDSMAGSTGQMTETAGIPGLWRFSCPIWHAAHDRGEPPRRTGRKPLCRESNRLVAFIASLLAITAGLASEYAFAAPTFPREGLVLAVPGRGDRAIISVDPI